MLVNSSLLSSAIKAFFFFALLPFVSPIPTESDVQPIALFFAGFILLYDLILNRLSLNKFEIIFFIFGIFTFVSINLEAEYILRHRIGVFSGFLVYYVTSRYYKLLTQKLFISAVLIFSGSVWVHFFFPDIYVIFGELFTRRVLTEGNFEIRGASGLAPENSFASALGLVYISVALLLNDINRLSKFFVVVTIFAVLSILFFSKSGLGYFLSSFMMCLFLILKLSRLIIISIICSVLIIIGIEDYIFDLLANRGGQVLVGIISNKDFIFIDGSVAERAVGIVIGALSLWHNPLGYGGGAYNIGAVEIDSIYNIQQIFISARPQLEATVSSFGKYAVEFGIFFPLFYLLLLVRSWTLKIGNIYAVFLAFSFIMATFSIAFPPIYLMLAISRVNKEIKI